MAERIHSITIHFEMDIHEDDANTIMEAMRLLRGVASVKANVADIESSMAVERARREMLHRLVDEAYKG